MSKRPSTKITYGSGSSQAAKRRHRAIDTITDDTGMAFVPDTLSSEPLIPTQPTSQAAAMASEPSAELVDTVISFTSCSTTAAVRALKVKNNNVEAAVNALFDGEDLEKAEKDLGWNEGLMNNVQPLGASAAPTRGNSPAPSMQPSTRDEEDHQIAAAIAASQQETGVVHADGTSTSAVFGPSNRTDYSNQWAMVRSGAQEVLADVEITQRVQDKSAAEPRFLKHLTDGDYTPNLFTICHAIPAAREALLMKSWLKPDYGYDDGWWRGQPSPIPTVVHVADGSSAETLTDRHEELIAEVQRLMAFLESSDRMYASTGGLTETKMIKDHNLSDATLLELFLKSWTAAVETKDATLSGVFTTKMGTKDKDELDTPYQTIADITVRSQPGIKQNLPELLNEYIWASDLSANNYIESPADVFVLSLKQDDTTGKKVGVDIPSSLHIDRFLHDNLESSKAMRSEISNARDKIVGIEEMERRLTSWQYFDAQKAAREKAKLEQGRKEKDEKEQRQSGPQVSIRALDDSDMEEEEQNNAEVKVKELIAQSVAHFSGGKREDGDDTNYPPTPDRPGFSDTAAKLAQIMTSIDEKMRLLAINKEETLSMISKLSNDAPASAGEQPPKHRYHLRGVATKPNITYVLTPKAEKDVEMNGEDSAEQVDVDDTTPPGMQWWRIAYESNGSSANISRTKTPDYDVLRAAELEHSSALLVYASERAVDLPRDSVSISLPEPLQQFIERDNEQFHSDLVAAQHDTRYTYFDSDIKNSIERQGRGRKDSNSSMDAIGASSPSPPVEEIHLSSPEDVEMLEKSDAKSLTLGDMAMGEISESHDGDGCGAQHVEDADLME